ncbi:MAG: hypothetical protein L0G49_08450 [Luteococcus sp.]|uniref:hypothetical protein n=1 Tax=Luteococcus sp. TaxID=1969402 RepID=UPI002647A7B8|nr:hypothetical protein [Luteococcus sp.]MDN5563783.1 hypothetical protein [Luteococcus sp.]
MKTLVSKAVAIIRAGWLGLAGQALTFIAMFAPLVWARFDQLSYLLVSSAGATVLAYTVTLAFSSLYPRVADRGEMTTALRTSLMVLLASSLALMAAASLILLWAPDVARTVMGWGVMTLFQGFYLMCMGIAVRESNYAAIPVARLIYGAILASLTIAACFFGGPVWSLVAATCLAYLLGSLYIAHVMRVQILQVFTGVDVEERPSAWRYFRSASAAGLSQALNGTASQLSVLILPGLGVFHDVWTAILRLVGGFGTVSQQLVAPALDIELSTLVRSGRFERVGGLLRKELVIGAVVALGATILAGGYFLVTPALDVLGRRQVITVSICMVLYAFGVLGTSVMFNSLILVGGDRYRVLWAGVKSLAILGIVVLGGSYKLVASVAVEVAFAIFYAALVFWCSSRAAARPRRVAAPSEMGLLGDGLNLTHGQETAAPRRALV